MPGQLFGPTGVLPAAGTTTTLDAPFSVGANVTLSNGNLTITGTSSSNNLGRSVANHITGKYYCEFTAGTVTNTGIGVCSPDALNSDFVGSSGLRSLGMFGTTWSPATGTTTAPALVTGHVYGLAIDAGNTAIWLKDITAASNWNANGTANPATNINGAIYSFTTPGVYVAMTVSANGDSLTFNFGASAYAGTPPSGFVNWL